MLSHVFFSCSGRETSSAGWRSSASGIRGGAFVCNHKSFHTLAGCRQWNAFNSRVMLVMKTIKLIYNRFTNKVDGSSRWCKARMSASCSLFDHGKGPQTFWGDRLFEWICPSSNLSYGICKTHNLECNKLFRNIFQTWSFHVIKNASKRIMFTINPPWFRSASTHWFIVREKIYHHLSCNFKTSINYYPHTVISCRDSYRCYALFLTTVFPLRNAMVLCY